MQEDITIIRKAIIDVNSVMYLGIILDINIYICKMSFLPA
jgi:hypothetical protein